jgi:hypothetical protein
METNSSATANDHGALLGAVSILAAVVAAGSVAIIGFTSFTAFDPPGWLRIATMLPLPVASLVALGFGWAGLRTSSGRGWAIGGLILAGLSLVAFMLMIATNDSGGALAGRESTAQRVMVSAPILHLAWPPKPSCTTSHTSRYLPKGRYSVGMEPLQVWSLCV